MTTRSRKMSGGTPVMDRVTFFRGLLFGLRMRRTQFPAEGQEFHRAFVSTLQRALETAPSRTVRRVLTFHVDPIFGVCAEASEMLLEGEQDRVLSLMNPDLEKAQFKINRSDADAFLERLPERSWFEELGEHFHQQLG